MNISSISSFRINQPNVAVQRNAEDRYMSSVMIHTTSPVRNIIYITFKGNPLKHPEQIANLSTEKKSLGDIYIAGGLGSVSDSLSPAVIANGKKYTINGKTPDLRDFYPYYTYNIDVNNLGNEGKIYVLTKNGAEKISNGGAPDINSDFKLVEQSYQLQDGEKFSVITENKNGKLKYFTLKDTGISGSVERVKRDAFEMEQIPYRMFEIELSDAERLAHPERTYLVHTHEIAKGGKAYGWCDLYRAEKTPNQVASKPTGSTAYANSKPGEVGQLIGRNSDDLFTTDFTRAVEDALTKMDTASHGNFNPQNIGINDRFEAVLLTDMIQKAKSGDKYWEGVRNSVFFHNIGRFYQGAYANPIDFFKIIATKEDLAKLKANPNFSKVEEIAGKIARGSATELESQQIYKFFKPYFQKFIDSEGTFNLTAIIIAATKEYPNNVVPGNVSRNFGKETRDINTEDIAKGLTNKLKEIEEKTVDIVNGENVSSMETENPKGFFGKGGLEKIFNDPANPRHYVPYSRNDSIETIYNAKLTNKKNLIEIFSEATEKLSSDKDALAKMIINNDFINKCRQSGETEYFTLGGFSKYAEGDILMMSWGRPDPQKGFSIALNGFKNFLQDESVPLETRKHCKLLLGGGGNGSYFRGDNAEWKLIKNAVRDIEELSVNGESGFFKGNVLYVNGVMPNRFANCSDLGDLTSRFEPCGITPLECYAAGTPVLSLNTGGAADFINNKTGFLTKDPYMLSPKALGLDSTISAEALETARLNHAANDVAETMKEYVASIKEGDFVEKQKELMKNALDQKIGWDENLAYNNGKSALEKHMTERWRCQDNNVSTEIKNTLLGEFDNSAFDTKITETSGKSSAKGSWWSKLPKGGKVGIVTGCVALGAAITYGIYKSTQKDKTTVQKDIEINDISDDDDEE